jgi:O-antigen ligase
MRGGLTTPAPPARPITGQQQPRFRLAVRADEPAPAPAWARPDALLYAVLGVVLTSVWRLHDLVPAVRALRPSIALTLLALLLVAIDRHPGQRLARLRSPVVAWLAVLLAIMVIGLPFSLDPGRSTDFFATEVAPFVLVGLLVAVSLRSVAEVEWLILGTLVAGCVFTLVIHAVADVDAGGRWTDMDMVYYDTNDLALMLVSMIPLTLYVMRRGNSPRRRLFAAACFGLFAFSMVRTGSRGGLVGFVAVAAYLLLTFRPLPPRMRIAGVGVAALLLALGGQGYWSRVGMLLEPTRDYNWSSESGRLAIWRRGLAYIEDRPLTGVGLGAFESAEREVSELARSNRMAGRPVRAQVAHNAPMQVTAELGIPGLVAFVFLLVVTARTLLRVRRRCDDEPGSDPRVAALAHALLASLIGFSVCGLFLSVAYFPYLQMLLGVTVAVGGLGVLHGRTVPTPAFGPYAEAQSRAAQRKW